MNHENMFQPLYQIKDIYNVQLANNGDLLFILSRYNQNKIKENRLYKLNYQDKVVSPLFDDEVQLYKVYDNTLVVRRNNEILVHNLEKPEQAIKKYESSSIGDFKLANNTSLIYINCKKSNTIERLDLLSGKVETIVEAKQDIFYFFPSPSGDHIIFQTITDTPNGLIETSARLFTIDGQANYQLPLSLYEVKNIKWTDQQEVEFYLECDDIGPVSDKSSYSRIYRCKLKDQKVSCSQVSIDSPVPPSLEFCINTEKSLFLIETHEHYQLYELALGKENRARVIRNFSGHVMPWGSHVYDQERNIFYYVYEDEKISPEIHSFSLVTNKNEILTSFNENINLNHNKVEVIRYKSFDQFEIMGLIVFPNDYDKNQKYNLIVDIHEGPGGGVHPAQLYSPTLRKYQQYFASHNYFVFIPNYRGSFPGESTARLFRKVGIDDIRDVECGINHVQNNYPISDKIGVTGHSYGAYLTLRAAEMTNISAVVARNAATDWYRLTQETFTGKLINKFFFNYSLDENKDAFKDISPAYNTANIKCPILLIHGKDDFLPVEHIEDYYNAIKKVQDKHKIIIYEDEGHTVMTPPNIENMLSQTIDFFNEHL